MNHNIPSPTHFLEQPDTPRDTPPLYNTKHTHLSHKHKLQWREEAKELMDATLDKWTYLAIPLTHIEDIHNLAKIAVRLAKIWAMAQSDPTC